MENSRRSSCILGKMMSTNFCSSNYKLSLYYCVLLPAASSTTTPLPVTLLLLATRAVNKWLYCQGIVNELGRVVATLLVTCCVLYYACYTTRTRYIGVWSIKNGKYADEMWGSQTSMTAMKKDAIIMSDSTFDEHEGKKGQAAGTQEGNRKEFYGCGTNTWNSYKLFVTKNLELAAKMYHTEPHMTLANFKEVNFEKVFWNQYWTGCKPAGDAAFDRLVIRDNGNLEMLDPDMNTIWRSDKSVSAQGKGKCMGL